MNQNAKSILISGISGFIGTSVANLLRDKGYNVSGLTSSGKKISGFEVFQIDHSREDLGLEEVFKEKNFYAVINLASCSDYQDELDKLQSYIDVNISLPTKLLKLMKKHNCQNFINTSSYWQYGLDGKRSANTLYAASKNSFHEILSYFSKSNYVNYIDLVLYDVYSLDDTRPKLINILAKKNNSKESFAMTKGEQKISFVHINDVANAYAQAIALFESKKNSNQSYFIHSGSKKTLRNYVDTFIKLNKSSLKIEWAKKDYPSHQLMDIYLGKQLPSWKVGINIEEGFKIDVK